QDPGRLHANVHRGRNELAAVDAIASWADDLRHVQPHTVPTLASKTAAVARTADGHTARPSLVEDGLHYLSRYRGAAEPVAFRVAEDLHHLGVLNCAAEAAYAQLLAGSHAPDRAGEDSVHAGAAQRDPKVEAELQELPQYEPSQPPAPDADP